MTEPTPEQLGKKAYKHPLSVPEKELPFFLHFGGPIIFDDWDRRILKVPEGKYIPMPPAEQQDVFAWTLMYLGQDIQAIIERGEGVTEEELDRIAEWVYGIGAAMGDGVAFDYPYGRERWIGFQMKVVRAVRWIGDFLTFLWNRVNPYYTPPEPPKTYSFEELIEELGYEEKDGEIVEKRRPAEEDPEDGA